MLLMAMSGFSFASRLGICRAFFRAVQKRNADRRSSDQAQRHEKPVRQAHAVVPHGIEKIDQRPAADVADRAGKDGRKTA